MRVVHVFVGLEAFERFRTKCNAFLHEHQHTHFSAHIRKQQRSSLQSFKRNHTRSITMEHQNYITNAHEMGSEAQDFACTDRAAETANCLERLAASHNNTSKTHPEHRKGNEVNKCSRNTDLAGVFDIWRVVPSNRHVVNVRKTNPKRHTCKNTRN